MKEERVTHHIYGLNHGRQGLEKKNAQILQESDKCLKKNIRLSMSMGNKYSMNESQILLWL